jgi:chromosome segregation ATPase
MRSMASQKKRGAKGKVGGDEVAAKLDEALRGLAAARADLNRAELRADRAESAKAKLEERVLDLSQKADAADIMYKRVKEEHATFVKTRLTEYETRFKALSDSSLESHGKALELQKDKLALLEKLASLEEQLSRQTVLLDAEQALRSKLEGLHETTSSKFDEFAGKTQAVIDENKQLREKVILLEKLNHALSDQVKDLSHTKFELSKTMDEARVAIRQLEQARVEDLNTMKMLKRRAEESDSLATKTLREAVKDKKDLTAALSRTAQLEKLTTLLTARVKDLEEQRSRQPAVAPADVPAGAGDEKAGASS